MSSANKPSALSGIALIVRREMSQYFGTWSGYIIAAAMLALSGLLYNVFAVGSAPRYSNDVLSDFFYYASGTTMTAGLLFSMRLIAEERQTGTFPLLASSQLSDGQVVFAKYLSALALIFIYLVLTTPLAGLVFINGKVAFAHIMGGYLGLMLIGSAAVAIGLYGSALVDSQLVALIISAVTLVVLLLLWITSRVVDGWLGDVISYLSLHDKHFRPFMDGTVSTANIIFYLSLTAFFLMLSRNALEARRWRA